MNNNKTTTAIILAFSAGMLFSAAISTVLTISTNHHISVSTDPGTYAEMMSENLERFKKHHAELENKKIN